MRLGRSSSPPARRGGCPGVEPAGKTPAASPDGELRVNRPGRRARPSLSHARPGPAYRKRLVRGFDLVVDELGADDRFQDDGDGFWNHGAIFDFSCERPSATCA